MDKKMKKIFGMLMFCFLALVLAPQSSVRAAYLGILRFEENLEDGFEETAVYSPVDVRGYYEMNVKGMYASSCKNIKAVSSDKKVATVRYSADEKCFLFTPKKPGKVDLTFSATKKGKKITCSGTVRVVRFKRPVRALKVDGKDYAKKIKTANAVVHIKTEKNKIPFEYRLQDGWELEYAYGQTRRTKSTWGKIEPIKDKKTFTVKKGDLLIEMVLRNERRGEKVRIYLSVEH